LVDGGGTAGDGPMLPVLLKGMQVGRQLPGPKTVVGGNEHLIQQAIVVCHHHPSISFCHGGLASVSS